MDEDEYPSSNRSTDFNFLSDGQVSTFYCIQIFSASLSVIGSSTIIFKILRGRVQTGSVSPYDRIILCLSGLDVLSSITQAVDQFFQPIGSYVWAFGGPTSCQIAGFLFQFSVVWSWWYNAVLSYYFLLMVLSQARQRNFVGKSEMWLHLSGIFFPITAIMGLFRGWFPKDQPCVITDFKIVWILSGIPTLFVYFSLIINNIVIYAVVRKSLKSTEHITGPTVVQRRLRKEAATMMFLYVGCFFVTVTPIFVKEILEAYFGFTYENEKTTLFFLWGLQSTFMPLQGFFNVFIYIRPHYRRFRAAYPNESKHFVLQQAILKSKAPPLQHHRVANHITHTSDVVITDVTLLSDGGMNPNEALFYPGEFPTSRIDFNISQLDDLSNELETNANGER